MNTKQNNLLFFILIGTLIFILLIKIILADVPEIFKYGSEFGEIIYDLSLAYISSYLFYQIVVALPKKRDLKNIYSNAKWISYAIVLNGSRIIKPKQSPEGLLDITDVSTDISEKEFEKICLSINIYDTFDFIWINSDITPITYLEHFKKTKLNITNKVNELFKFISHLETEHIKLINDITDCPFMTSSDVYLDNKIIPEKKENLEFLCPMLFDFYTKIRNLNNYVEKIKL